MKRFTRFTWKTGVFALVILLFTGLVARQVTAGAQTVPNDKDVAKAQRTAVPKSGPDERIEVPKGSYVAGNGVVEPSDRETKVAAQVAGRIARILVKEGDAVEKDAPMAELENASERAALDAAEGDLAAARADLTRTLRGLRKEDVDAIVADTESIRARSDLSKGKLVRTEKLAQTGASTPDELDSARRAAEADQRNLESAEAKRKAALAGGRTEDILVAQAKVQGAVARRDQAKAAVEQRIVKAPISGEILQVKFRAGEYYQPGGDPLLIMGDTTKLRVRMDVDERDIGKLAVGAPAFASLSAFPGRRVPGKIVEIGKRMGRKNIRTDDPTERIDTKILEVVIELDEKTGLFPGLRVTSYVEVKP